VISLHFSGALLIIPALKHANILKSTLVENRNVLLSYLQRDTEMSESGNLELPHQLGETPPANSTLEYHSGDAGHDTPNEPTSTGFETASYQAHETSSSMLRTSPRSEIGTSPYVHSNGGASKNPTSSANRQSKMIVLKVAPNFRNSTGAMSSQPFNTELVHSDRRVNFSRRASSFVAGESPRRSRSPTPVSTKKKNLPPTAHEKAHRIPFLEALIQEGVPWSDFPSLYREEFGIWRSQGAIRTAYNTYKNSSKGFSVSKASPAQSASNEVARRSGRTKSPTPVATKGKRLPPTAHEEAHRLSFVEALIQEHVPWSQIPSLYREEFGIWRSADAIRSVYRKGSASNEVGRRSRRTKSPTPVSTAKKNLLPSAHEKAHRIPFLEALIQEGVPWSQFPSLYREEFGIWRSEGAIRTAYHTHRNRSKGSASNEVGRRESEPGSPGSDASLSEKAWSDDLRAWSDIAKEIHGAGSDIEFGDGEEGPSAQNPANRGSKKRNRSSTQSPVPWTEVPATEQEMLHRIPFLKSKRAQGLTWPKIALSYQEEFGISRSARALSNCYHQDRRLSEMGISDQELASAQMSESENEEEPLARKRLMMSSQLNYSHSNRRGSKEDSVSKASFPRRSSVSIESSSESSSSESTPPPVTGPRRIDLTSPGTSPANPLNPTSAAPALATEPTLVKSHVDDLESSPAQGGSSSNGRT
jgi:hypothetical protein